jgi:integrase/recombinase XerD
MVTLQGVDSRAWWRGTEEMENSHPDPAVSGVVSTSPVRRLADAAYLARFKGQSRIHPESDLRGYLTWCEQHDLDPLGATRPHIELFVRWLQEVRRHRPSTVSRRMSVVAGLYRTCVIDGVLEHSPAESVRRPNVPAECPTLGLTHLQFEALLTTAKQSTNRCDFAPVTMLGLLGSGSSKPPAATSRTSARSTATEC